VRFFFDADEDFFRPRFLAVSVLKFTNRFYEEILVRDQNHVGAVVGRL